MPITNKNRGIEVLKILMSRKTATAHDCIARKRLMTSILPGKYPEHSTVLRFWRKQSQSPQRQAQNKLSA
jgi:hypothetical protein